MIASFLACYRLAMTGNLPDRMDRNRFRRLSVNNPRSMRDAVLEHLGIAVIPTWLIEEHLKKGKVNAVLSEYTPKPRAIHVLYPQRQFVPAKVRCKMLYRLFSAGIKSLMN